MKVILIIILFLIGLDIANISYNVRKIREIVTKEMMESISYKVKE